MNRRPPGFSLSKALVGFEQAKAAEGLSPRTLVDYSYHLKLWIDHNGDVAISQVCTQDIRAFLAWLRTDYRPKRFGGDQRPLSPKTIRNVWITLSSPVSKTNANSSIAGSA